MMYKYDVCLYDVPPRWSQLSRLEKVPTPASASTAATTESSVHGNWTPPSTFSLAHETALSEARVKQKEDCC